jgi:hypothetical protein
MAEGERKETWGQFVHIGGAEWHLLARWGRQGSGGERGSEASRLARDVWCVAYLTFNIQTICIGHINFYQNSYFTTPSPDWFGHLVLPTWRSNLAAKDRAVGPAVRAKVAEMAVEVEPHLLSSIPN